MDLCTSGGATRAAALPVLYSCARWEGRQVGRQEGRQEGRQKGRQEGKRAGGQEGRSGCDIRAGPATLPKA